MAQNAAADGTATTRTTTLFENGLIWFGAGVSLAEILTGTYFAPLGLRDGLLAIVVGHVIGCVLLFLLGVVSARTGKSAMEAAAIGFGGKGTVLFAVLNVLQLVGWTGIMIYDGALSADGIVGCGTWVWCVAIGGLIVLWVLIGLRNLGKVNAVAVAVLFALTVVASFVAFKGILPEGATAGAMSFGAAVELAVAMPLSWLPLVGDYTRTARRPVAASATSAVIYGLVSCWMYAIGMGMAMCTGESDIAQIMLKAGLGVAGLVVVVFSTVTTTYLDAYSAGVSSEAVGRPFGIRVPGKWVAVGAAVIGTVGATVFPMDDITDFLYLIGSVFAPMAAILIADYFLLRSDASDRAINWENVLIWIGGFALYRFLMGVDTPLGSTLPCMLAVIAACCLIAKIKRPRR